MSLCNPLKIYAIGANSNITMQGYGCLDGSNPGYFFSTFNYSRKKDEDGTYGDCDDDVGNSRGEIESQSGSGIKTYTLDQYGDLDVQTTTVYRGSDSGYDNALYDNVVANWFGEYSLQRDGSVECIFTLTENGITTVDQCVDAQCDWGGLCLNSIGPNPGVGWTTSCERSYKSINTSYDQVVSCCYVCGAATCPGGEPPCECSDCDILGSIAGYTNDYAELTMNGKMESADFLGLAKESAVKKLDIKLKNGNQSSDGSNCGPNKDSCWGLSSNFKVALDKDSLLTKFKEITGRVFLYTLGGNPNTSPCCNSCGCFDGTILKSQGFTLSASGLLFNPYGEEMIAINLSNLDFNSANYQGNAGMTLGVCAVVDSITQW